MIGILNAVVSVFGAVVFLVAVTAGLLRHVIIVACALLREWRVRLQKGKEAAALPAVTVLIASRNEQQDICTAVQSALDSSYPDLRVLVADDGSTDATHAMVERAFGGNPRVRLLPTPQNGKVMTLLEGAKSVETPYIVTMDADTVFEPSTVHELMRGFRHESTVAVAGNIKVKHPTTRSERYQALEYVSINFERRALDLFRCVSVIPGAVGAWKKEAYLRALGEGSAAGDVELTLRALREGGRVAFAGMAVAYTAAPSGFGNLLTQRRRWSGEKWAATKAYGRHMMRDSRGFADLIAALHVVVSLAALPLLLWWVDVFMALRILQAAAARNFLTPAFLGTAKLYAAYLAFDFARAAVAASFETAQEKKLLRAFLPQSVFTRQLQGMAALLGLLAAGKGAPAHWEKEQLKGPTSSS